MVSDWTLFKKHYIEGVSYKQLADTFKQPEKDIRSRVARVGVKPRIELIRHIAENKPIENEYTQKQIDIVTRCENKFNDIKNSLGDDIYSAVFLSDIHYPYTNWEALEIAFSIIQDINPIWISSYNDLFDMKDYSSWDNIDTPSSKLWGDNIDNAIKLSEVHHKTLKKLAPNAHFVEVTGNHDIWLYSFLRKHRNGFSEKNIYTFMSELEKQGVLLLSYNNTRSIVELSDNLVWFHGHSAATEISTIAMHARKLTTRDGKLKNTVAGHTHRIGQHSAFGVTHYNSGCFVDFKNGMPYLPYKPHWDLGFVVCHYNPMSNFVKCEIVKIEGDKKLYAYYNNKYYKI